MTLYLARHGQTEWNHSARIQGREDIPLNETGISQAQALGKGLRGLGIERIWSSPLSRAQDTARTIARACGIERPITLLEGLVERDFGASGGMTVPERAEHWPDEESVTGQEPFPVLQARALAALEHILRIEKSGTVLAVSHGALIDAVIRHFTKTPFEGIASIRLRNCSVTRLDAPDLGAESPTAGFQLVWSNRIAGEFLLSEEAAARAQANIQGVLR